jgi:ribosome-binding protein aMBF1 (putative translation factor)
MANAVTKLEEHRLHKQRMYCLGNTGRKNKHMCHDLIHDSGLSYEEIAEGAKLHVNTIRRMADCEDNYIPSSDTVERIQIFFKILMHGTFEDKIQPKYQNKSKE